MIRILALLVISTLLIAQSFVRDLEDLALEFAQEFNSGKIAAINKAIAITSDSFFTSKKDSPQYLFDLKPIKTQFLLIT